MGFCHVGHAGLELLTSSDLPALASQSAGIAGERLEEVKWQVSCRSKHDLASIAHPEQVAEMTWCWLTELTRFCWDVQGCAPR